MALRAPRKFRIKPSLLSAPHDVMYNNYALVLNPCTPPHTHTHHPNSLAPKSTFSENVQNSSHKRRRTGLASLVVRWRGSISRLNRGRTPQSSAHLKNRRARIFNPKIDKKLNALKLPRLLTTDFQIMLGKALRNQSRLGFQAVSKDGQECWVGLEAWEERGAVGGCGDDEDGE